MSDIDFILWRIVPLLLIVTFFVYARKKRVVKDAPKPLSYVDIEAASRKLEFMQVGVEYPIRTMIEMSGLSPVEAVIAAEFLVRHKNMVRIYRITNPTDGTTTDYPDFMSIPDLPGLGLDHVSGFYKRISWWVNHS